MIRLAALLTLLAGPALAAVGDYPFFSLRNTDIVVALGFIIFVGILVYYKVPAMVTNLLDKRADDIRAELAEARRLREEAQEMRAAFERKKVEVKEQAERIVAKAKADAETAAEQARADLEVSITRRLKAAEDQIASAEAAALRDVRNRAVQVAVAASAELIAANMSKPHANRLIEESIKTVDAKLH
ncbi:F0F1 ATP synthase subunit B [Pararhodobacter sp. SW119]|uniref:F0F1 ATP synthase subunit B n=1 Tax=Pararhodobacter sp. SW119 TaxID=2780075 RepID=UPI001ADEE843|nr:F0F1 ATP synthase subunit B [Pararhodobacter sp. SW119]